jgi:hypothetical protein
MFSSCSPVVPKRASTSACASRALRLSSTAWLICRFTRALCACVSASVGLGGVRLLGILSGGVRKRLPLGVISRHSNMVLSIHRV